MNFVAGNRTLASFDWSAVFLVALGLLVLLQFRLAIVLARLVGLMALVGLALAGPINGHRIQRWRFNPRHNDSRSGSMASLGVPIVNRRHIAPAMVGFALDV